MFPVHPVGLGVFSAGGGAVLGGVAASSVQGVGGEALQQVGGGLGGDVGGTAGSGMHIVPQFFMGARRTSAEDFLSLLQVWYARGGRGSVLCTSGYSDLWRGVGGTHVLHALVSY